MSLSCLFKQQLHTELSPTSFIFTDLRLSPDSYVDFMSNTSWCSCRKLHLLLCCCQQTEALSCSAFSMLYTKAPDLLIYSANTCGALIAWKRRRALRIKKLSHSSFPGISGNQPPTVPPSTGERVLQGESFQIYRLKVDCVISQFSKVKSRVSLNGCISVRMN